MGATGGQVVRSVVLEAFVVGAVASAIGLGVGILLGQGLLDLLSELGLDLPATSTVVLGRTIVVSLFVGVARHRGRRRDPRGARGRAVPPVAAIADIPERAVGGFGRRLVIGGVVLVAGGALLAYGLARARDVSGILDQVQVVAFGAFGVLVGVVLLLPAVVRPAVARDSGRRCAASVRPASWRVPTRCATRAAPPSPRRRWSSGSRWSA